jgi:hypothetical protein
MTYVLLVIDKALLVLAVVMLLRALLPLRFLDAVTATLQTATRFVTPLGFHERVISLLAVLWLLGLQLVFRLGAVLW